jgi:hypothetical protein
MNSETRHNVSPIAFLVVLLLLMLIVVRHSVLTANEAEKAVVKVQDNVVRNTRLTVAVVAMVALLAYLMWTLLRADQEEAEATPPAKESSASDKTAPR